MPVSLHDLVAQHGLTTPEAQMASAARHWDWEQLLTLSHRHPEIPPAHTMQLLAERVRTEYFDLRPTLEKLWDEKKGYTILAPAYLESWMIALLEQGLPLDTPLAGTCRRASDNDQEVSWSGGVPAMAVAMGLPKVFHWLCTHAPEGWMEPLTTMHGRPTPLLHLALRLNRWSMAKSLVEQGFDPHCPDPKGALPWEVLSAAAEAEQKAVMDTLGLWPRSPEEMTAGWKRRGTGVGQDRRYDQAWRMLMATTIGEGSSQSHELLVRDFLDPHRSHIIGDKTWPLWISLSHQERTQVHSIKNNKLPGQWSLNRAALFLSACEGLEACWEPVEPGSTVKSANGNGFITYRDKSHTACHLRAWTDIAPAMTEAELDAPILTKKWGGQSVTLTSRGLRGLAHWEWAMRDHWGEKSYQAIQGAPWGAVTEQEVRAATDALQVMRSVVSVKRLSSLDKLLTHMLFPKDAPNQDEAPWYQQLHTTFGLSGLLELQGRLWRQRPQDYLKGEHFIPGLAWVPLLLQAPPSPTPWSPEVRARLPDVWADLTQPLIGSLVPQKLNDTYKKVAEQVDARGQILEPLRQWGFEPTPEQWAQLKPALMPLFQVAATRERLEAEGRSWALHQAGSAPDQTERRRPRLRT